MKQNKSSGCGCLVFLLAGVVVFLFLFAPEVIAGFTKYATTTLSKFFPLIIILLVLIIATPIVLFFQRKAEKKKQEKELQKIERSYNELLFSIPISLMSPLEYEDYIAAYVKRKGYINVHTTKVSGDFGADVLCESPTGRKICIQCKHYSKPVGIEAVQQVLSAKVYYECEEAWVCASDVFTLAAQEMASKTGVKLLTIR